MELSFSPGPTSRLGSTDSSTMAEIEIPRVAVRLKGFKRRLSVALA